MESNQDLVLAKAKKIKLLVSDVDGVLTNGELFFNENGEEPFGKFNIYDGYAVIMAHACGLNTAIISGRHSLCTEKRMRALGTEEIHTGVLNKRTKLEEIIDRLQLDNDEVAFIGDDLIDLPAMKIAGFTISPKNGVQEIVSRVDYVSETAGGHGVLREVVELIIKAQGKYEQYVQRYLA